MNSPELPLPLSDDPEELHTWREIVRRLRCAISICRVALDPRAAEVRRELGQFAKTMAAARDLDVQSAHVRTQADSADPAESSGYAEVLSLLSDMRNAARAEMLASLSAHPNPQMITTVAELAKAARPTDSSQLRQSLSGAIATLTDVADTESVDKALEAAAPAFVRRQMRRVRREGQAIKQVTPTALHQLRIEARVLRDTLQITGDLFSGRAEPVLARLIVQHDILGRHHDAWVGAEFLRSIAASPPTTLTPDASSVLTSLAARYDQRARRLEKSAYRKPNQLQGPSWRKLQKSSYKT